MMFGFDCWPFTAGNKPISFFLIVGLKRLCRCLFFLKREDSFKNPRMGLCNGHVSSAIPLMYFGPSGALERNLPSFPDIL